MMIESSPKRLIAAVKPATNPGVPTEITPRSYGPVCGAAAGLSTCVTPTLKDIISI